MTTIASLRRSFSRSRRGFLTIRIGSRRSYVRMTDDATGIASYDADGQADLAEFAEIWAQNIEAQGWLEHATCTRLRPESGPDTLARADDRASRYGHVDGVGDL